MRSFKATLGMAVCAAALAGLAACSKPEPAAEPDSTTTTETPAPAENATAAATPAAAGKPAADNFDTLDGTKLASLTGDAAAGEKVFAACKTCHSPEAGKNMVGPSLHGLQGRAAGSVAGFNYSTANKTSGITWSNEKMFQYLENPQRVVPGTKMTYTGVKDAQKRADLVAYLDTLK